MEILVAIYSPFEAWCIPDAGVEQLRRDFPSHTFAQARTDEDALARIRGADVVFGARIRPEQFAAAARLRWVHSPAAGVGNMLFPALVESDVVLTNSRGITAEPIAEHVIGVILALLRRLPLAWERQRERVWAQNEYHARGALPMLKGSRVLVVGLGSIGGAVATLAAAFGARVVGIRRTAGSLQPGVEAVLPPERLLDELALADVVVVAAPQTAATTHLFGARELARMKDGAVLVNVSRGKLIDEAALARELQQRRIRAALDVFEHEPLAESSPLWGAPGALITPHVSGFFAGYWPAAVDLFAANLRRFDSGLPLLNQVDKEAGY